MNTNMGGMPIRVSLDLVL